MVFLVCWLVSLLLVFETRRYFLTFFLVFLSFGCVFAGVRLGFLQF